MKKIIFSLIVTFCISSLNAQNKVKIYNDKKQSSITYSMSHPLHSWTATSNDISSVLLTNEGKTEFYQVAVITRIASFDSKNSNRDSHALEATEALKYPNISFTSNSINVVGNKATIRGNLTFHGVVQPIVVDALINNINGKMSITGKFSVTLTQFKIVPPSMMGLSTKDNIDIDFKIVY